LDVEVGWGLFKTEDGIYPEEFAFWGEGTANEEDLSAYQSRP
jgi:hypothetical protein